MDMKKILLFTIIFSLLFFNIDVYSQPENDGPGAVADVAGEKMLDAMTMAAENDYLELYINEETTEVAIKDKESGYVWYTNPKDRASDPKAKDANKDKLASQISITYYTPTSQAKTMNNYTDSILLQQFDIQEIKNGVKINYRIGKESKVYVLPMAISKERMEEKILNNIKQADAKKLLRQYRELSLDNLSESKKDELLAQYPSLANRDIYVLTENIRDYMKESLEQIVLSAGYTIEDMNQDHISNNVPSSEGNQEVFKIPLEYTLEGENLVIRIPTDEIEYNHDSFPLYSLRLLEFFGAAGVQDEGYILVPDGSGSLIYLNNNKLNSSSYAINIYGDDRSVPLAEKQSTIEQAYMPVFGMKKGNNAFFAIIESGDAMARVCADINGKTNSYNWVCSEYILIPNDILDISDYSGNYIIMVHQPRIFKGDIKVRYKFLSQEDADYSGMARYYRQYLQKQYDLTPIDKNEGVPFYLELIGAIRKVRSILGVPVNILEPVTTYEQAIEIIEELNQEGIENIILKYTGATNGGVHHTIPTNVALISKLGGKSGFKKLQEYLEKNNFKYFMDFGIAYAYKNTLFDDFIPRVHASRYITKEIGSIYDYNIATNVQDFGRGPYYIISPSKIPSIVNGMIKDLGKLSIPGVSIRDAAIDVNSDFKEKALIDRQEARDIISSEFKKIKEEGLNLMVDGGNAYSLAYADYITNIPEESNNFHITDESIPFFQMVIRGYIDYTGKPINLASDYKRAMLKEIEVGSGVHFCFIYDENSVVKETYYDNYYSCEYRIWLDRALEFYKQVNSALADVRNQAIIRHEKLSRNVYKTVFENGDQIIVNYNEQPVNIEGMIIDGLDYKIIKGGNAN